MKAIISLSITLFFIMDPLGNIPLFISELYKVDESRRKSVLMRELFIALVVLLTFFFLGDYFLDTLHLTTEAISIGGGIVLFVIALRMIFPPEKHVIKDHPTISQDDEPFIVSTGGPIGCWTHQHWQLCCFLTIISQKLC